MSTPEFISESAGPAGSGSEDPCGLYNADSIFLDIVLIILRKCFLLNALVNCVFCEIVEGSAPSYKVYEDSSCAAFLDTSPITVGHTLVIPKGHSVTLPEMDPRKICDLFNVVARISPCIVRAVAADGFRLIQNNGEAAAQVINHVHVHVVPMSRSQGGFIRGRLNLGEDKMLEVSSRIRQEISKSHPP